jgi:hypothetical protein
VELRTYRLFGTDLRENTAAYAMTSAQWIGLAGVALILALGWFAFRQGMKVKPDSLNQNNVPPDVPPLN